MAVISPPSISMNPGLFAFIKSTVLFPSIPLYSGAPVGNDSRLYYGETQSGIQPEKAVS
jgi:hypothetical protein